MKIQELNIKLINNDNDRFKILKSLTIGNIFLFNEKEKILFYLKQIEIITKKLILKDGGHVSRNPRKQLKLLRELIEIRAATASIPEINNSNLHKNVNLMSKFFKMFCMPDGSYCFFNGGSLIQKLEIYETLKRIGKPSKNFEIASFSGYCKFNNKSMILCLDLGTKESFNLTDNFVNKASVCSFELYYKKQKLITNLGDLKINNNLNSILSLASSAAHSTLIIDDRNNIDLLNNRKLEFLKVKKNQNNLGDLIEIEHSGYENAFGVNHKRTIFIKKNGLDLRGIDEVINIQNSGVIPREAKIRFHLSSLLKVFELRNKRILIKHKDGLTFYFISSHKAKIEKTTIFCNNIKKISNQIVINVPLSDIRNIKIKKCNWSFKFEN